MEYVVVNVIGRGSFGIVSIIETEHGQFALKTVYQDRKYYNRELEILQKLHHENIVKLQWFYCSEKEEAGYILNLGMEYVPYALCDVQLHKNLSNPGVKKMYIQALEALKYLHSMGICHRDIKPQNILVDLKGNIKLCDFGSAKQLRENESNVSYICSRSYRAPELLMGTSDYNFMIDVWSLALVICEFRIEGPLFQGCTSEEVLEKILEVCKVSDSMLRRHVYKKTVKFFNEISIDYILKPLFKDKKITQAILASLRVDPGERKSAAELLEFLKEGKK